MHYFYVGDDAFDPKLGVQPETTLWKPQPFTGPSSTEKGLNRICFQMQFKADDLAGYVKDHEAVWPEMQEALKDAGWHNYSLFYREDGFACGFFETDAKNFEEV